MQIQLRRAGGSYFGWPDNRHDLLTCGKSIEEVKDSLREFFGNSIETPPVESRLFFDATTMSLVEITFSYDDIIVGNE